MKIFSAIQTQWNDFASAINKFTSKLLGREGAYAFADLEEYAAQYGVDTDTMITYMGYDAESYALY